MNLSFRRALEAQLDKRIRKALLEHAKNRDANNHILLPGSVRQALSDPQYIYLTATGTAERDMLLARGWELISQDMSERAQWVHCYMMRKRV